MDKEKEEMKHLGGKKQKKKLTNWKGEGIIRRQSFGGEGGRQKITERSELEGTHKDTPQRQGSSRRKVNDTEKCSFINKKSQEAETTRTEEGGNRRKYLYIDLHPHQEHK